MKILIIEDDPAVSKGLSILLESEGYKTEVNDDGFLGMTAALRNNPDMILLDVNLPSMNGFDVCRKLRENKFINPIIMLTSRAEKIDVVLGLEIGADDYITKPFDNRIILARIRSRFRSREMFTKLEAPKPENNRSLAAILFSDMCDYSAKMEKDELKALKILEIHNAVIERKTREYHGEVVEIIGDAFLISFNSVTAAVQCGISIQEELKNYNAARENFDMIKVRMGIHIGDVIHHNKKLKGSTLNIAARIQQQAVPGLIYISEEVYHLVKNHIKTAINSEGIFLLKNIEGTFNLYSINL